MAEGIGDALAESWREFRRFDCLPGHDETLLAPDCTAYRGKGVGEGSWPLVRRIRGVLTVDRRPSSLVLRVWDHQAVARARK